MSRHVTGHTGLLCLLGSPVAHSISPEMHNEACRILDLDYEYLAFDVGTETLETAVAGLKVMGVRGFNLTMPDKNKMAELCDELSQAAKIGGAVNTVVNDNGKLTGHTTDGVSYMMAAKDAGRGSGEPDQDREGDRLRQRQPPHHPHASARGAGIPASQGQCPF